MTDDRHSRGGDRAPAPGAGAADGRGRGPDPIDEPVLDRRPAPEHGPDFWAGLEAELADSPHLPHVDAPAGGMTDRPAGAAGPFTRRYGGDAGEPARRVATTELPDAPVADGQRRGTRPPWVAALAVAATALVLVGLGVVLARGGDDRPGPEVASEWVPGTPDAVGPPLDGSSGDDGAEGAGSTAVPETGTASDSEPAPASGTATPADAATSGFTLGAGAVADRIHLPRDGGVPDDATILATWPAGRVTWYAVTDPDLTCDDMAFAEIRFVGASGLTLPVHDPQLRFSGDLSRFLVAPDERHVAWLVSCGTQLELHVADLLATGRIEDPALVWFGAGMPDGALVAWDGAVVSLNAFDLRGEPYFVAFDVVDRGISGTALLPAARNEPGVPPDVRPLPLAAGPAGLFSYWAAPAVDSALAASDRCASEVLWLRQPGPRWVPATDADLELRGIDVVAIGPEATRIAFADSCEGRDGRVFVGVPGGDGLIRELREIDLSPYVPGYADRLFWVDDATLRIETDNRAHNVDRHLFDYRLGTGDEPGELVLLGRAN